MMRSQVHLKLLLGGGVIGCYSAKSNSNVVVNLDTVYKKNTNDGELNIGFKTVPEDMGAKLGELTSGGTWTAENPFIWLDFNSSAFTKVGVYYGVIFQAKSGMTISQDNIAYVECRNLPSKYEDADILFLEYCLVNYPIGGFLDLIFQQELYINNFQGTNNKWTREFYVDGLYGEEWVQTPNSIATSVSDGFMSSDMVVQLEDMVHKSTNETITGKKTFNSDITFVSNDSANTTTPQLVFLRGDTTDSKTDWRLYNTSGGKFTIQCQFSQNPKEIMSLATNSASFGVPVSANAISIYGGTDKQILLANGSVDNTTIDFVMNSPLIRVYHDLTGTASKTSSPYYCSQFDVTDNTITEYVDGMIVSIKVPVAGDSNYGTALQINSLGYKPIVYNVSSMVGTRYSVGSNIIAVYNATQTASLYLGNGSETITGCWQVMDYDTNTIAYNIRANNITRTVQGACYRYRICFSSADGTKWVAANHSTSTTATASKTVATEKIDPFGEIIYYNSTTAKSNGSTLGTTAQYTQYCGLTLGYSFNRTGAALVLSYPAPVYVKCTPQSDGSAIIDPDTPYTQALPSTNDGKIYIYLGHAYSAIQIDMTMRHPVYYHNGTKICLWTSDNMIPSYSSADAGKFLKVNDNGTGVVWSDVGTYYIGSSAPANSFGNDGDMFLLKS